MSTSARGLRVLAAGRHLRLRLRDRPALPMAVAGILRLVTPVNDGDSVMMLRLGVEARRQTLRVPGRMSTVPREHRQSRSSASCVVMGALASGLTCVRLARAGLRCALVLLLSARCLRLCSDNLSTVARGGRSWEGVRRIHV